MSTRRHRRVRKTWTGCKCPPGSKRVSTEYTTPDGQRLKRGRGWGCLGVGVTKKGRKAPRFVKALCDTASDLEPAQPKRKPGRPRKAKPEQYEDPTTLVPRFLDPQTLPMTGKRQAALLKKLQKARAAGRTVEIRGEEFDILLNAPRGQLKLKYGDKK